MSLEFTEYDRRFEQFMSPLTAVVDALAQQLQVAPDPKNLEMKVRAVQSSSRYFADRRHTLQSYAIIGLVHNVRALFPPM